MLYFGNEERFQLLQCPQSYDIYVLDGARPQQLGVAIKR
jgi:hypothetical protein